MNGSAPEDVADAERERLRDEQPHLGLLVQGVHVHTDADSAGAEKVAQLREEDVFLRVHGVTALLSR
ncbi:hypothetical protein AB0D91_03325 [Streptomyces canus]|uniref:hypothetical protein n=1 Tax=Streptomyces canus TaxID=58343 RepID=UPI0033E9A5EB